MFKKPLTPEQFAIYQKQLKEMEDLAASRRLKGLKTKKPVNKTGKLFGHLPPDIADRARDNLARYMADPKHAERLAAGGVKRASLYAALVAAAIARAKYPNGMQTKEFNHYCRQRRKWKNKLKRALGLKEAAPYIPRVSHYTPEMMIAIEQDRVDKVHPGNGQPLTAEQGMTDMTGI